MSTSPSIAQIKASAGSGKTYALTQRFLGLLSRAGERAAGAACLRGPEGGFAWTDILAATFTNKAAGEMRQRVVERLKRCALGLEGPHKLEGAWTPDKAAYWVDTLLRGYGSLNIRTIDSLLITLARLCALDLGLPPAFEPAFSRADYFDPLYEEAVATGGVEGGEFAEPLRAAFLDLLRHTNLKGFDLGADLRSNLGFLFDMAIAGGPLPVHPAEDLAAERAGLARAAAEAARLLRRLLEREKLAVNARFTAHLTECDGLADEWKMPERTWPYKAELNECLNAASKGCASLETERAFESYAAAWKRAERGMILLTRAMRLAPLARLASMLAERLPEFQRRNGLVPHILTPLHVRRILDEGAASDAFCRLGSRIAHILVDEFQDTSREQWAALEPLAVECLSSGGTLTLVGDVKQAIYRWRGGDAALFDEVVTRPELTDMLPGQAEIATLDYNRRSCRAVVAHNNRVFSRLGEADTARCVVAAMLPAKPPRYVDEADIRAAEARAGRAIRAAFADARQDMPPESAGRPEGYVRLLPVAGANTAEYNDEARERLRLLLEELAPRRAWKDVAVLVHKNAEAALVAEWLMEWGVPTVTDQSLVLARHPLIRQVAAFLAFMNDPADDVSLWALLSAHAEEAPSLIGEELRALDLTLPRLVDWLMERGAKQPPGGLGMIFRADFPRAWERIFAPFHQRSGLIGPYDATAELFSRFAAAERFPLDMACLRRFLEIAHRAEERGLGSLSAFLEHWAEHGAAERVPMPEAPDAVRILTMHKAKGLEFPVVIIPFHHQSAGDMDPTRCRLGGRELILRPSPAQGGPYYHACAETAAEKLHVLYVAWTRAVEELYGFLPAPAPARTAGNPANSTGGSAGGRGTSPAATPVMAGIYALLAAAGIDPGAEYETGTQPPARPRPSPRQDAFFAPAPAATSARRSGLSPDPDWLPMAWLPRLKIFRSPLENIRPIGRPAALTEAQRGLFVHGCLEQLIALPWAAGEFSRQTLTDAANIAAAVFPLAVPDSLRAEAVDILAWVADLPEAERWFRLGRAEQSILDEQGTVHRADLLVEDGTQSLVIEYKTGAPNEAYRAQVERYLALLARRDEKKAAVAGRLVYLDLRKIENIRLKEA